MKTIILTVTMSLAASSGMAVAGEVNPTDTTIRVDNKRIEITEMTDRMKVRIYELDEQNEEMEDELIFEGHYKGGQSYEKRYHRRALTIPLPTWDKYFDAHWAGFGMGFANFADGSLNINDINGVSLRSEKSLEYNLNFLEKSFPFSRYNWAVVTGLGIRWNRYRLNTNNYFKENADGITVLEPAPEGIVYTKSRLNTTSLTFPVLFEWQSRRIQGNRFFFSAGLVGVVKTISSSKVEYRDANNKKQKEKMDRGMNIRPVTMDFLLQGGYDWVGFYVKYSPMRLFEGGKGPNIHPVSIGLHLHL
ncbi:MAG: outer membrane beta-barrel protein [Massilibacteroides sp.]|nr:outer membrane beta-barrel protein [Massilibacteroides sp.]MDD3063583.1 outer membrane beta-barrel protein [Massilibacteroides sp.]MDD4114256.1 outer membrane beta-barrel protein [Massilibacteroides sp.]MDD4661008.1 outer membrane beta-barrel protein [Massilibacteroides sp.]